MKFRFRFFFSSSFSPAVSILKAPGVGHQGQQDSKTYTKPKYAPSSEKLVKGARRKVVTLHRSFPLVGPPMGLDTTGIFFLSPVGRDVTKKKKRGKVKQASKKASKTSEEKKINICCGAKLN